MAGGWWLVAGGWWLVAGGWWLVAGGWWLVAGGWWLVATARCGGGPRAWRGRDALHISANLTRVFDGPMAFVPEGQADSSQARSAWSHEESGPVPAGRLNRTSSDSNFQQEYRAFLKRYEFSFDDKYLWD